MKLSIKFFRRKLPQKFDKSAKKSCSGELKCFYYQPTFRLHAATYFHQGDEVVINIGELEIAKTIILC